jgi:hypothetical protein
MSVESKEDGMRYLLVAASILLASVTPAQAQVSVGIGVAVPGVRIGINVPAYPELVPVPGYPVYYDPRASTNYFFYDGAYWVFQGDSWYSSSWYDGPWYPVRPEYVPAYVLRVPVRDYRSPPPQFRGWRQEAPPRWGEHWGRDWEHRRHGWDRWDRHNVPRPAPLPVYQRAYPAERYPRAPEQQHAIRSEQYRYRPRETVTREHYGYRGGPPAEPQRQGPGPQGPRYEGPGPQGPGHQGPGRGERRDDDRRREDRGRDDRGHDDRGRDDRGRDDRGRDDRGHDDRGHGRR